MFISASGSLHWYVLLAFIEENKNKEYSWDKKTFMSSHLQWWGLKLIFYFISQLSLFARQPLHIFKLVVWDEWNSDIQDASPIKCPQSKTLQMVDEFEHSFQTFL